jgi:hypothetical protein
MNPPLFVRRLSPEESQALRAGLRSPSAFTLRRCQILLTSAEGLKPSAIRDRLGCATQTVRDALRAFAAEGTACLREKSHRPKSARPALDAAAAERLRALLHRSPRDFGKVSAAFCESRLRSRRDEPGSSRARVSRSQLVGDRERPSPWARASLPRRDVRMTGKDRLDWVYPAAEWTR